jgi:hypothetical protein
MNEETLQPVYSQIYKKYKWCKGIIPQIFPQPNNTYLLVFETSVTTDDNHALSLILRVTIDEKGKVLKTSTSR